MIISKLLLEACDDVGIELRNVFGVLFNCHVNCHFSKLCVMSRQPDFSNMSIDMHFLGGEGGNVANSSRHFESLNWS
jgi:hypothetical protein